MQESGQFIMSNNRPDWTYEVLQNGNVCGVDEAGRGPLAGPVVACAVILNPQNYPNGLNDSKRLSPKKRELLLNEIKDLALSFGIGIAEPEEIDRYNILQASLRAMARAVDAMHIRADIALIDGTHAPKLYCKTQTIIKGDSKSLSIAAASILAKVTRDQLMQEADKRYPNYGFSRHKGYPTAAHKRAIIEYGPCSVHRRSFNPVKTYYT